MIFDQLNSIVYSTQETAITVIVLVNIFILISMIVLVAYRNTVDRESAAKEAIGSLALAAGFVMAAFWDYGLIAMYFQNFGG